MRVLATGAPVNWEYSINLEDFDPSKISWYSHTPPRKGGYVTLRTRENKRSVKSTGWASKGRYTCEDVMPSSAIGRVFEKNGTCYVVKYENDYIMGNILEPESDNGPRLVKALQHLVRLCGGKEELF